MPSYKQRISYLQKKIDKHIGKGKSHLKPITWTNWVDMVKDTKINSGGRVVPFIPYDYQIKCIDLIEKNYLNVIAKGRQLGLSQIVCSWLLFRAITEPGFTAVIISKTQNDTSMLAGRIKQMAGQLSDYFDLENESLMHLKIRNAGQLFFRNSTINSCRGIDSVSCIFFDEAAFIPDLPLIFSAATPALSMVGNRARIIFASTPNGLQNCPFGDRLISNNFDGIDPIEKCQEIREGKIAPHQYFIDEIGTCKQLIHWRCHPIYSKRPNYIEEIAKRLNEPISKVAQEYDLSFTDVADAVFTAEIVRPCRTTQELTYDNNCLIYIGADFASSGKDYTVFTVFQEVQLEEELEPTLELIHMYRQQKGTIDSHILALGDLIDEYGAFAVGIETTGGLGLVALQRLAIDYRDVQFNDIKTTNASKLNMIEQLRYCLEKQWLLFNEKRFSKFTNELLNFRRLDDVRLGAGGNGNDDIVMSSSFAIDSWFKYSKGKGKGN